MTEVVTALVHSPKLEKKIVKKNVVSNIQHPVGTKNGKPSRRWLISELERTIKRNADLNNQLKTRDEIERNLVETKSKLERELAFLKSRKVIGAHENEAIRERNKQLSQDIYLMKNILVKLNTELEFYQGKLRKYENEAVESGKELETGLRHGREWLDGELTVFAPLVNAYEEALSEKEQLIQDQRAALQRFSAKIKEIITENTHLRQKITESVNQGEVSYTDWVGVQREMALTTEQNLLLKRQANLNQAKISQLKAAFQAKLAEVNQEKDDCCVKYATLREEHMVLKGKLSALEVECQRLKEEAASRIPEPVHSAHIAQCRRLLEELKSRHEEERDSLIKRVCTHETETPFQNETQRIRTRHHQLISACLRELEIMVRELENRCARSERRREGLKLRLDALVAFSKELITEHERLLKALGGELGTSAALAARLETIKRQLQSVEAETRDQIKLLDENIVTQVERVNRQCSQQKSEIDRLRQQLLCKHSPSQEVTETIQASPLPEN